jgi:hypothetical protein
MKRRRAMPRNSFSSRRSPGRGSPEALPFELRALVLVARPQRRLLAGRRPLDVAVNADGAAVDDAADARAGGGVDDVRHRLGVDRVVLVPAGRRLAVCCPDVIHDVDAGEGTGERGTIRQVAGADVDPEIGERRRARVLAAHERTHGLPRAAEVARQVAAGEPRRARD